MYRSYSFAASLYRQPPSEPLSPIGSQSDHAIVRNESVPMDAENGIARSCQPDFPTPLLLPFVDGFEAFCFGGPAFFGFRASLLPFC
jgi:hypothetical protein